MVWRQDKVPVLTLFNLNGPDNFAHLDRALLNGAQLMGGFHRYGHQLGHQEVMRQEQDEKFGEEMLEMVYQVTTRWPFLQTHSLCAYQDK